jgi:hypothetical protein
MPGIPKRGLNSMIGGRVAFRGGFGPHEGIAGIVLEETEDSVVLAVENNERT